VERTLEKRGISSELMEEDHSDARRNGQLFHGRRLQRGHGKGALGGEKRLDASEGCIDRVRIRQNEAPARVETNVLFSTGKGGGAKKNR